MQTQAPEQTEAKAQSGLLMYGKPITPGSFVARAIAAGHTLELTEDGEIDNFALAHGYCNGPCCSVCCWGGCVNCDRPIPPCDGGIGEGPAHSLLGTLKALVEACDERGLEWSEIEAARAAISRAEA